MNRRVLLSLILISAVSTALAADTAHPTAKLTAAEIAEKNVQARGGLQSWRGVQTLSFEGKMAAGGNQRAPIPSSLKDKQQGKPLVEERLQEEAQLPFKILMQRPRQTRLELQFRGQTAVQVYDGSNGWKLRPFLNRTDVEPYTAEELKIASAQPDLDGPLVDYAAKGTRVELDGMEKVEDRDTYKLKLTLKSGEVIHVWIDAATFLEAKVEGQPRRLDGQMHPVEIYYRDYRAVNGLQIPHVLETRVLPLTSAAKTSGGAPISAEKITIEKVSVNPKLVASSFTKPVSEKGSSRN